MKPAGSARESGTLRGVARSLLSSQPDMDSAMMAGVSLLAGGLLVVSPLPVAAALGVVLAAMSQRVRPGQLALGALVLMVGARRASNQVNLFEQERTSARDKLGAPSRCGGTVVVASAPVRLGDNYVFRAEARELECDGAAKVTRGTLLRLYSGQDDLARGDECFVVVSLAGIEFPRNEGVDTPWLSAARQGSVLSGGALDLTVRVRDRWSVGHWIDRGRAAARRRIEATYPAEASALARALVLGENDLDMSDSEAFRASGLSHILAVSGTHIVIAVYGMVRLLQGLLVRLNRVAAATDPGRVASAVGLPLAWWYAEFAGSGGSVRRAAVMASATLLARAIGRYPDGARGFGLSLLAGAVFDPLAVFDGSFGLSAAATSGLLLLSRPMESLLARFPRPLCWASGPLAATMSATLCCGPWLAVMSPNLSLVGLAANVIAVPIGEVISLPACLGHLLLSPVPAAERGVALVASASLLAVRAIAHMGSSLGGTLPVPRPTEWQLATLASVSGVMLVRSRRGRAVAISAGAIAYLILEAFAMRAGQPRERLRITFLDVGQGDSMLVDFPDGRAMLVDGGGAVGNPVDPGKVAIGPLLRARRRNAVDIAVLSHPHPDHFIGLRSSLRALEVGEFWDTGQGEKQGIGGEYEGLLAELRGRRVRIRGPSDVCGPPMRFGEAQLEVLAPCPNVWALTHANDNSFVIRVSMGTESALLVGDAERQEEERLIATWGSRLGSTLLKVGHHGSGTSSSPEFMGVVRPKVAVISCGVRNRFGHPHPRTLALLQAQGVDTIRTDRAGGIVWETDGRQWKIRTWAEH